ncbi:hypothetical protein [Corynebacterium minutissimum]|uniref:Hypothetical membrane protein n=1 Tax=Corynebacterium minutissimum TaxID=38301 RepID=A0A376D0X6_9CORY|nr:hypothetical protein [Corynebacterium minutissimum]QRP61274.1 hypothetical protein I6J26_01575 [Corynebacterium minutissimum]STC79134.1 hypothetical membrane protein [Corynebacterium minutissimum]
MRNFRTAAVAAATAASVAFAGTSVAFAAETEKDTSLSSVLSSANDKVKEDDSDATLSSKWGDATDADTDVTGADLFGENVADDTTNPDWAIAAREGLYASIGTAVAGALIAAYNFAVYNNIVPAHVLDPFFRR